MSSSLSRIAYLFLLYPSAYLESVDGLFLSALIVSFGSLICALFATNYYLGQNHNAIETHKILRWREPDEVKDLQEVENKNEQAS